MIKWMYIDFLLIASTCSASAQLRVSANNYYLYEQQTGEPVFLNGESVWCLMSATTYTQADSFFQNCQQYGINFLEVQLIDKLNDSGPQDRNGNTPFTSTDFITPREAYFTHADSIVGLAKTYGIYLHLYISYLGANDTEGWRISIGNRSIADMKYWGDWLGARYKDSTNIMWGISGDCDPTTWQQKLDSMSVALLAQDTNHLITPRDWIPSITSTHWSSRSWLKLEYIYPYWGPQSYEPELIVSLARTVYASGRPGFLEEAWYENEKFSADFPPTYVLRQQMYYTILSGAVCGHVFGTAGWAFDYATRSWFGPGGYRDSLDSQGHQSTGWCGKLFRSRYWYKLHPDTGQTVVTAGYGSSADSTYCPGAYASDGSSIIVYLPSQRTITIDPAVLAGDSCRVYWFDPATGAVAFDGNQDNANTFQLTSPAGDRVLVVDSKNFDLNFDAPGGDEPQTVVRYLPIRKN